MGGRIASYLLNAGEKVRVGTSRGAFEVPGELAQAEVVRYDLLDGKSLELACEGVTAVIHLAAMNVPACESDPEQAQMINGIGTFKLLKAARQKNVERFLYFSTIHVYGASFHGVVSEETLPRPTHPYAITHRLAEDYVLEAAGKGMISGVVFRLSNAVGAPLDMNADCWMLLVNDLCRQAVTTKALRLRSSGEQYRNFVAMTDVMGFVRTVLVSPKEAMRGRILNIGGSRSCTVLSIAKLVQRRCELTLGYCPGLTVGGPGRDDGEPLELLIEAAKRLGYDPLDDLSREIDETLLLCKKSIPS